MNGRLIAGLTTIAAGLAVGTLGVFLGRRRDAAIAASLAATKLELATPEPVRTDVEPARDFRSLIQGTRNSENGKIQRTYRLMGQGQINEGQAKEMLEQLGRESPKVSVRIAAYLELHRMEGMGAGYRTLYEIERILRSGALPPDYKERITVFFERAGLPELAQMAYEARVTSGP